MTLLLKLVIILLFTVTESASLGGEFPQGFQCWDARGRLEAQCCPAQELDPAELHQPRGLVCSGRDLFFPKALSQGPLSKHSE